MWSAVLLFSSLLLSVLLFISPVSSIGLPVNPLSISHLTAISSSRVHHPHHQPVSLNGRTAWMTSDLPHRTPAAPFPAPCPIVKPWNVTLPLLQYDLLMAYSTCQMMTLLTCASEDDCPSNVTATNYQTGETAWVIPYSNSSNDTPLGEAVLLNFDTSLLFIHKEAASTVNETCNSLSAHRTGAKTGLVWNVRHCVPAVYSAVKLFTFTVVETPTELVLWWAVEQNADTGDYTTHYTALDAKTGERLHTAVIRGEGIVTFQSRDDMGTVLVYYVANQTELINTTKMATTGEFHLVTPLHIPRAITLYSLGPVAMVLNLSFTSFWGQNLLTNEILYIVTKDDILFEPYSWLTPYDGFEMVYTSYAEFQTNPTLVIINAVAENRATNQLIGIVALYDPATGKRTAVSPVLGPVAGDGNVILLQFIEFADGGKVPIILIAHHFWVVNPTTLAVLSNGEKPFGELDSYTQLVSSANVTAFASVTVRILSEYAFNFVGSWVYANASSQGLDVTGRVKALSE